MSIRAIVVRGYSNGSFNGTIKEVVTRGYAISAAGGRRKRRFIGLYANPARLIQR